MTGDRDGGMLPAVAIVLGLFAVGLAIAGLRARDKLGRAFFLACALLNAAALGTMLYQNDEMVFRLQPNPNGSIDDAFRR